MNHREFLTEDAGFLDDASVEESVESQWLDEAVELVVEGEDPDCVAETLFAQIDEAVLGSFEDVEG